MALPIPIAFVPIVADNDANYWQFVITGTSAATSGTLTLAFDTVSGGANSHYSIYTTTTPGGASGYQAAGSPLTTATIATGFNSVTVTGISLPVLPA